MNRLWILRKEKFTHDFSMINLLIYTIYLIIVENNHNDGYLVMLIYNNILKCFTRKKIFN